LERGNARKSGQALMQAVNPAIVECSVKTLTQFPSVLEEHGK
jgi:hypothetical protein